MVSGSPHCFCHLYQWYQSTKCMITSLSDNFNVGFFCSVRLMKCILPKGNRSTTAFTIFVPLVLMDERLTDLASVWWLQLELFLFLLMRFSLPLVDGSTTAFLPFLSMVPIDQPIHPSFSWLRREIFLVPQTRRILPLVNISNSCHHILGPGQTDSIFPLNNVQHCWI